MGMSSASTQCPFTVHHGKISAFTHNNSFSFPIFHFYSKLQNPRIHFHPNSISKGSRSRLRCMRPDFDDFSCDTELTPLLDLVENPIHLKNLSLTELKQLAKEIRLDLSALLSNTGKSLRASSAVVELTVAIHHVFNAPVDKILWDIGDQTYAHKILTGRRDILHKLRVQDQLSACASEFVNEYDPFSAGHGCNSISAGLGMAVARDIIGKRDRIVTVISNETTMAGQVYEAMSNAGFLDSNMVVILNDSRHSLHPKIEEGPKTSINVLSSALSKIQSSKSFRKLRETAKGLTKKIGRGMHEWAAKVDEYARGMMGPQGSTLYEELGLYYIGPVDGHSLEDLICVLQEVACLDSMGPVLVHVITEENQVTENDKIYKRADNQEKGSKNPGSFPYSIHTQTYSDNFVDALIMEAERDKGIVVVHGGMEMERSLNLFEENFPDRFFDVGMAEQHAVTFSAGLSRGGLKPFCIISSAYLQRAFDQVVHDVDRQKIPVRFVITSAGLVGSEGALQCGAFDITFMSCLPNMIVMAPSDEDELAHMIATAAQIDDNPVCFRYPRGAIVEKEYSICKGIPIEIGKGRIIAEGKDVAFLGYGAMVGNCLKARSLLLSLGIEATVADARFCKPLDIKLIRQLCQNHEFLITVEEGSVGGFGSHVAQVIALDGHLDGKTKWRPIVLPDTYIEHAPPGEQLIAAGLTGHHIAATALNLLGRVREALLLMS